MALRGRVVLLLAAALTVCSQGETALGSNPVGLAEIHSTAMTAGK